MELRGTRPVKDDPDALLKFAPRTWYGWPDYSADLQPITAEKFQPPPETIIKSSYSEVSFLIDHNASNAGEGLIPPWRGTLLAASFPSLSGAAKFDFVPAGGPFGHQYRGNAIIALSGDRAPFATGGYKQFSGPIGFKVVRVDMNTRAVEDFIRNTRGKPASQLPGGEGVFERPVAVRFSPDGSSLYIVDFGRAEWRLNGKVKVTARTGKIFVLEQLPGATSRPVQNASATTQPIRSAGF
jgi:glucose/arabinose dehydrogenase